MEGQILELEGTKLLVNNLPNNFVGGHGCGVVSCWLLASAQEEVREFSSAARAKLSCRCV